MNFTNLNSLNLHKKRVFLRADLNVPIKNGQILQDFKLESALPTIDFILKNEGKIILATHIGRPDPADKSNVLNKDLSTQILIPWFENRGYKIDYEADLLLATPKSHQQQNSILLLENMRFFVGEKEGSLKFAEILASTADLYVDDAFGNIHRSDTSMTLLAQQYSPAKRCIGLLIEKEMEHLEKIRLNKSDKFIVVLGGIKIKDKLAMLENFMINTDKQKAKALLIGGGIALAFLKANGKTTGSIEIEEQTVGLAKRILHTAQENGVGIILPIDQIIQNPNTESVDIDNIPATATCIDIGPKTIQLFSQEIKKAKVIFANGTMGICEIKEGQTGTQSILQAIIDAEAFNVVGGGDTTAAVFMFGLQNKLDFLSTGGGATLKYLGCKNPETEMPGLQALVNNL